MKPPNEPTGDVHDHGAAFTCLTGPRLGSAVREGQTAFALQLAQQRLAAPAASAGWRRPCKPAKLDSAYSRSLAGLQQPADLDHVLLSCPVPTGQNAFKDLW